MQEQIENLQKVLFSFQGFVPLVPALWNTTGTEKVKTRGVVPHSNAHFMRAYVGEPKATPARRDDGAARPRPAAEVLRTARSAEAPHGDAMRAERMSLLHVLNRPRSQVSVGASDPNDTARMRVLQRAVADLTRLVAAANLQMGCSKRPENVRAILFISAKDPVPRLLYPLPTSMRLDAIVLNREEVAQTRIECGHRAGPSETKDPGQWLGSFFHDNSQSDTSE